VVNATIRNSTLGYMGINAIGFGTFTVENSTIYGRHLINLRSDYGSTWRGDFVIRNCTFVPSCGRPATASLIGGYHTRQARLRLHLLHARAHRHRVPAHRRQQAPRWLPRPRHPRRLQPPVDRCAYVEEFPYVRTSTVTLRDITTASGKPCGSATTRTCSET
jgi:hypothetical protein